MKYLRTPYRYGGTTSRGFDCSGFTSHVYREFGYNLDRSSRDQAKQFPAVSKRDLKTGDLVFFEGRSHNGNVGHVGIVTENKGNGEFKFIHASVNKGVIVSSSNEAYYASRYLKAGRVIDKTSYLTSISASSALNSVSSNSHNSNKNTVSERKNISDAQYHNVKKGENLSAIAIKYDVPISTLMHLNNLKSKKIKRGQRLMIAEAVEKPKLKFVPLIDEFQNKVEKPNAVQVNEIVVEEKPEDIKPEKVEQNIDLVEKTVKESNHQINTEPRTSSTSKHKVAAGESLYSISKKYNITVDELKRLNDLSNNSIAAGQMLKIENSATVSENITDFQQVSSPKTITHTVQSGESLYAIARMYKCSVTEIRDWNPNLSDKIKVGDKIKIAKN